MEKLLGSFFVIFGLVALGYSKVLEEKRRIEEMEKLYLLISKIEYELEYLKMPIPELCTRLIESSSSPFKETLLLFQKELLAYAQWDLASLWEEVVIKSEKSYLFKAEELEILKETGRIFQQGNDGVQRDCAEGLKEKLSFYMKGAREEWKEKRKVYMYISLGAGLSIVLILI